MTPPGSAVERTTFAWWRTELSTLAVATLLLKLGITHHNRLEIVAAAAAFATAVILYVLERAGRTLRTARHRRLIARVAAAAATVTVVLGAASVLR